jgi:TP901 family phage tail tape measure protein
VATRKISTRITLDGEREYRESIRNLNREMRTLQSELKLVDNQFKGQANTLTALEEKNRVLNAALAKQKEIFDTERNAAKRATDQKKEFAENADKARKELEQLIKSTDAAGRESDDYKKKVAELEAEIKKYEEAEKRASREIELRTKSTHESQIKLNDLGRELEKNEKYLNEARNATDKTAKSIDAYGQEVKKSTDLTQEFGENSKEAFNALAEAMASAGVVASIKQITDALIESVEASIEFESAMAGVAKTTDLTAQELLAMGDEIKEISTNVPITTTEFARIAETAGQLGVAKDDLMDFSRVMADLGVATNMTSDEAATMLAQFTAVTGMDTSKYSNLGAVIVALGNNFATNERKITEMAQGIAAAGTNAKISESDMMALSAAVTSLGIETAAGSTSMSKLITEMQNAVETGDNLNLWAETAGMSASEFATLWGTNATGAIQAFIKGLGATNQPMSLVLQNLGINEIRMTRMITSMANAEKSSGMLSKALDLSSQAWKENTALVNEASQRYQTTESKITMYKNAVNNLKIAVGDDLTPALRGLVGAGTSVVEWATEMIKANDTLIPIMTALVAGIGAVSVAMIFMSGTVQNAITALANLAKAAMANPYVLIAAAVVALGTAIYTMAMQARDAEDSLYNLTEAARELPDAIDEANKKYDENIGKTVAAAETADYLIDRLDLLKKQYGDNAYQQEEYKAVIAALVETIPELSKYIDQQTGELLVSTDALRLNTEAWKLNAEQQAKHEFFIELYRKEIDAQKELYENKAQQLIIEGKLDAVTQKRSETQEKIKDLVSKTTGEVKEYIDANSQASLAILRQTEEGQELIRTFNEQNAAVGELEVKYARYSDAIKISEEKIAEFSEEITDLDGILDNLGNTTEASGEQFGELGSKIATEAAGISEKLKTLETSYNNVYDEAYETISGQMGLFEDMSITVDKSVKDMLNALDTQIQFQKDYSKNFNDLISRDIKGVKDLAMNFADGSKESAAYLAALADATDDEISQMISKMGETKQGWSQMSADVAIAKTDIASATEEMAASVAQMAKDFNNSDEAYLAGAETIRGLIDGLQSELAALRTKASEVKEAAKFTVPVYPGGRGPTVTAHAQGIGFVPYDDYYANLHRGEMVLTAAEARAYRNNQSFNSTTNANTANIVINAKSLNENEINRLIRRIDNFFGNNMTVKVS